MPPNIPSFIFSIIFNSVNLKWCKSILPSHPNCKTEHCSGFFLWPQTKDDEYDNECGRHDIR